MGTFSRVGLAQCQKARMDAIRFFVRSFFNMSDDKMSQAPWHRRNKSKHKKLIGAGWTVYDGGLFYQHPHNGNFYSGIMAYRIYKATK